MVWGFAIVVVFFLKAAVVFRLFFAIVVECLAASRVVVLPEELAPHP